MSSAEPTGATAVIRPAAIRWMMLRFVLLSIPLFLLWALALRDPYLSFLARIFAFSARVFGLGVEVVGVGGGEIELAYHGASWRDQFGMTGINVVALAALVLATGFVPWRRRLQLLGIALGILFATQVLGLWTDLVDVHLHTNPRTVPFSRGLREFMTGFGTFLFPVLIWLVLVRRYLPLRSGDGRSP
jgi:hypothetical protein